MEENRGCGRQTAGVLGLMGSCTMAVILGGPPDTGGDQREKKSQNDSLKSHGGWEQRRLPGREQTVR